MTSWKLDSPIFSPAKLQTAAWSPSLPLHHFYVTGAGRCIAHHHTLPWQHTWLTGPFPILLIINLLRRAVYTSSSFLLPDAVSAELTWPVNLVSVILRLPTLCCFRWWFSPSGITAPQFLFSGCSLPVSTVFQKNTFWVLLIFRWLLSPDSSPTTPSQTYLSSGRFHPGKICFC